MLPFPISDKTLKSTNSYWFTLYTQYAFKLALLFLRADPAANSRQPVGLFDLLGGFSELPLGYEFNEFGYLNFYRAPFDAKRVLALNAAFRFLDRLFGRKTERDFIEVLLPLPSGPLFHVLSFLFFCHF
jgi:hypothetical protein